MMTLQFANTHNLVAFLSKPAESEGFEQIVDFLNTHIIKYALTLQALVDGKKIVITKATIKRVLQLEDAEGIDLLHNATIFEQLTLMRYEKLSQKLTFYKAFFSPQWKFLIHTILQCLSAKTTAWNEFRSTMASTIICLATNQKFNFSKYIFDSMVRDVENVEQIFDVSKIVQKKQKPRKPKRKDNEAPQPSGSITNVADEAFTEENVTKHSNDPLLSGEDSIKLEELMELCTNLQQRVIDLETTKTTQGSEIASLKKRVKKLEKKNKSRTHKFKRLYKVGLSRRVETSDEASLGDQEDASKQGRKIDDINADVGITLVDETQGRHDDDLIFDTGDELEQEKAKKQKVDKEKETAELQSLMKIVPNEEEVAIDVIPLATKLPSIIDYKIIKEGKISYF
ncbi:hypothetical protein Tco_0953443 [Tanacetum coccineum]|uniref:Synaptobrevin, longin-like domain protein n=1 Tax=Tanacetum coccineum TaxID=301880 RepID=A0ABQ5E2P1_9ASTR